MKNAIIYLLIFIGLQLGITFGVEFFWKFFSDSTKPTATMLIVSMAISSVAILVVFLCAHFTVVSNTYLKSHPWTVLAWSGVAALGAILPSEWIQEQLPELPNFAEDTFDMILRNRMGYLVIGLLAPLAEEVVFRGAILRGLLNKMNGHWWPIVITALLFALVHGNPVQMPHAFLVGILLGWMCYRTGSIVPGIAYHWVNNTVAYIAYNLTPNPNAHLIDIFGGNSHTMLMAVGCSLLILIPAIYQLHLWMKPADQSSINSKIHN